MNCITMLCDANRIVKFLPIPSPNTNVSYLVLLSRFWPLQLSVHTPSQCRTPTVNPPFHEPIIGWLFGDHFWFRIIMKHQKIKFWFLSFAPFDRSVKHCGDAAACGSLLSPLMPACVCEWSCKNVWSLFDCSETLTSASKNTSWADKLHSGS